MADQELPVLGVLAFNEAFTEKATGLAESLGLPLLENSTPSAERQEGFVLWVHPEGLALQQTGKKAPGPIRVDFVSGAMAHRRVYGGGAGEQVAKAVGVKGSRRPSVLDATAGLGRDSFVLACLGCDVMMYERNRVVAALLADGLERAACEPEVAGVIQHMSLHSGDVKVALASLTTVPDVIYLDPMFPHSDKSAEVKKEMKAFRSVVGADEDAEALFHAAKQAGPCRVVVKRPRKAPLISEDKPSLVMEGKSGRFDIYAYRALPE
ncbi:class I SAM-dependent methyltransferase [Pokkaliibacter sp. CJK22405]|uniref:class I SAM-dependent methyltransferase n=1 Tax=Pokkaliibacter sp. CJK22405 TaxID=3384615 RepID=UPI0039852F2D